MLAYDFNLAKVFAHRDLLLRGVWLTIQLTLLSAVLASCWASAAPWRAVAARSGCA
jgi:hypothetical protein